LAHILQYSSWFSGVLVHCVINPLLNFTALHHASHVTPQYGSIIVGPFFSLFTCFFSLGCRWSKSNLLSASSSGKPYILDNSVVTSVTYSFTIPTNALVIVAFRLRFICMFVICVWVMLCIVGLFLFTLFHFNFLISHAFFSFTLRFFCYANTT